MAGSCQHGNEVLVHTTW